MLVIIGDEMSDIELDRFLDRADRQYEEDMEMRELKHTPTPWEPTRYHNYILGDEGSFAVAHVTDGPYTNANTAIIVRAVNAHEKLVAACEAAMDFADATYYDGSPEDNRPRYGDWPELDDLTEKARDALALVRGETP